MVGFTGLGGLTTVGGIGGGGGLRNNQQALLLLSEKLYEFMYRRQQQLPIAKPVLTNGEDSAQTSAKVTHTPVINMADMDAASPSMTLTPEDVLDLFVSLFGGPLPLQIDNNTTTTTTGAAADMMNTGESSRGVIIEEEASKSSSTRDPTSGFSIPASIFEGEPQTPDSAHMSKATSFMDLQQPAYTESESNKVGPAFTTPLPTSSTTTTTINNNRPMIANTAYNTNIAPASTTTADPTTIITNNDRHTRQLQAAQRLNEALENLSQIDFILVRISVFWSNTEVVLDVLTKKGQHVEQMISFASKPKLLSRFKERLEEYKRFWESVSIMCSNYVNGVDQTTHTTTGDGGYDNYSGGGMAGGSASYAQSSHQSSSTAEQTDTPHSASTSYKQQPQQQQYTDTAGAGMYEFLDEGRHGSYGVSTDPRLRGPKQQPPTPTPTPTAQQQQGGYSYTQGYHNTHTNPNSLLSTRSYDRIDSIHSNGSNLSNHSADVQLTGTSMLDSLRTHQPYHMHPPATPYSSNQQQQYAQAQASLRKGSGDYTAMGGPQMYGGQHMPTAHSEPNLNHYNTGPPRPAYYTTQSASQVPSPSGAINGTNIFNSRGGPASGSPPGTAPMSLASSPSPSSIFGQTAPTVGRKTPPPFAFPSFANTLNHPTPTYQQHPPPPHTAYNDGSSSGSSGGGNVGMRRTSTSGLQPAPSSAFANPNMQSKP